VTTKNQCLRARYYDPQTGSFLSEDSYAGDQMEPLSQNRYTYAENNPVNQEDPSGRGIFSWVKKAFNSAKKFVTKTFNSAKKFFSKAYTTVKRTAGSIGRSAASWASGAYQSGSKWIRTAAGKVVRTAAGSVVRKAQTVYQRAKQLGQSTHNWVGSRLKEAGNIQNSWTKAIEHTVKHFCTTANRVLKPAVELVKKIDWKKVGITVAAVTVSVVAVAATGGLAGAAVGALGLASGSLGAAVAGGAVSGAIGGAAYGAAYSGLSGNDAKTVLKDTAKGALGGGITGGALGGIGYGSANWRIKPRLQRQMWRMTWQEPAGPLPVQQPAVSRRRHALRPEHE